MGFTVRFVLGLSIVLLSCWNPQATFIAHEALRANDSAETVTKSDEQHAQIQTIKTDKPEDLTKIDENVVANLDKEKSDSNQQPKTDSSTETNVDTRKTNLVTETAAEQTKNNKLQKSEAASAGGKIEGEKRSGREGAARSIDIEKFVSKDFHSINNVYTLPVSQDTEKYINPDFLYHSTTHNLPDHTKDFHFNSELTTPKSSIFDGKFKAAVESVDQTLEHIDHEEGSPNLSTESDSSADVSLDTLYEETKNNETDANLNYINYKNIVSNGTANKNSVHKDLVVEAGTNLDFSSVYNKTEVIDETSGNGTDSAETSTAKPYVLTTRKSVTLTKPPSNRNNSHILSNKIETETVKAVEPISSNSITVPVTEATTKGSTTTPVITKRGSVKFADYALTTTTPVPPKTRFRTKLLNNTIEQSVQENQIVPVLTVAPKDLARTPAATTTESNSITSEENHPTTTEQTTTGTEPTTTDSAITNTRQDDASTTPVPTTDRQETTTNVDSTTDETTISTAGLETTTTFVDSTTEAQDATTTTEDPFTTTQVATESTANSVWADATTEEPSTTLTPEPAETTTGGGIGRVSKGFTFKFSPSTAASEISTTTEFTTTESEPTTTEGEQNTIVKDSSATTVGSDLTTPESTGPDYTVGPEDRKLPLPTSTTVFVPAGADDNQTTASPEGMGPDPTVNPTLDTETPGDENSTTSDGLGSGDGNNGGTIAAITISSIGAVCLILLAGLLFIMRKRQKRFNYGQRCTPVSLDDYSMDNISVYNSVRRKGALRNSKRSHGNPAFEDPASVTHPLNFPALGKFARNLEEIRAEFEEIPQITARTNELPEGCDTKNRYANVIPLPETRVFLAPIEGYPNSDYINANYVTGPNNTKAYYIACQAPMQNTVDDFWRMVWEQQCKVVLMLTHLFENGVEKCVDYLPPSEVLDCHRLFGDFQVTLKKREVKEKYIISILQLKNMVSNSWREITHFWYMGWPEKGVPAEANSLIAFLIEARSYMKTSSIDRKEVTNGNLRNGSAKNDVHPVVVHCSPGTGRTGVVIACDIAIREFEKSRLVDVPRIVYKIRRDRASAVQTKDQYAFIYKVINLYATKLTGGALDSL